MVAGDNPYRQSCRALPSLLRSGNRACFGIVRLNYPFSLTHIKPVMAGPTSL